jgi:two-component system sensor histidine kinase RstB
MTRLFIQFYVGVLAVLIGAWCIYGVIADRQVRIEVPQIVEVAHRGGARLLAQRLDAVSIEVRPSVLDELRQEFGFTQREGIPIRIMSVDELPEDAQQRIAAGEHAVYNNGQLATPLASGNEILQLGPFPKFTHYERAMQGGIQLAVAAVEGSSSSERDTTFARLSETFGYAVEQIDSGELPTWERLRIAAGEDTIFYIDSGEPFVLAPLSSRASLLRFGPLPDYGDAEQRILAKSTAIVLLITAFAIAILLRPMARQLRRVESAARAISSGDLSARVDESKVRSAKPLAEAFNQMATRTETLLRTQREILQAVSHELRTPLSRIRFAIDLIETAKDDDERTNRLQSLDDATSELDELVGELLRYVRLESGQPLQNCETLSLDESFRTLIDKYAALFPNISFTVSNLDDAAIGVQGDSAAFHRAIGNLLSNAGRFAKNRVVTAASSENGVVSISVDDDGPGIPEADRERVFEPFTRLNGNAATRGVGLGLAIVRRIVIQHGGRVTIHSSSLGGCRIVTTWPQPDSAAE